jgi:hypothetical protein
MSEIQQPVSESKPIRLLGTVLSILVAGSAYIATINQIPDWVKLLVGGLVVLITAGMARWAQGRTVPYENVKSRYIDETGETVAGPAAEVKTGTVVAEPVPIEYTADPSVG